LKNKLISKAITYFCDKPYHISTSGFVESHVVKPTKILILARQHYIERIVALPIIVKKDLKAAIEFEVSSLLNEFHVFHKTLSVADGISQIVFWQIPKSIIPKGTLIVLPETYILASLLSESQLLSYLSINKKYSTFIIKSNLSIHSVNDSIDNLSLFKQATGVAINYHLEISEQELASKLLHALKISLPNIVSGFWIAKKIDKEKASFILKAGLLPVVVCSLTYLILSSAYISIRHNAVLENVNEQKNEIDSVLNIQNDIVNIKEQIAQYSKQNVTTKPLWNIWKVLFPLYERGVMFKFIRFNGKSVFFRARHESATTVLEYLYDIDYISSPTFTTAIRKEAALESFIIKFSLISAEDEVKNEQ